MCRWMVYWYMWTDARVWDISRQLCPANEVVVERIRSVVKTLIAVHQVRLSGDVQANALVGSKLIAVGIFCRLFLSCVVWLAGGLLCGWKPPASGTVCRLTSSYLQCWLFVGTTSELTSFPNHFLPNYFRFLVVYCSFVHGQLWITVM